MNYLVRCSINVILYAYYSNTFVSDVTVDNCVININNGML